MVNQKFLSKLALGASFFALGVIALGAFTRLIDAGLGCPDWPGCYGHMIAPWSTQTKAMVALQYPGARIMVYKAWAEMVHRYFVGGLSLLIVAIVMTIASKKTLRSRSNALLAVALLLLLAYQIMLGQWTVTLKLLPVIVAQHLLGGFLILVILWMVYLSNNSQLRDNITPTQNPYLLVAACGGLVLLILQILLGAWTSTNYAAFVCDGFPFCQNHQDMLWNFKTAFNVFAPVGMNYEGGTLPIAARQTIQMTHRLGALVLTFYLFVFAAIALLRLKKSFELQKSLYVMLAMLCVQLSLGISNIILNLPLVSAVGHNLAAILLLLTLITFTFKLAISQSKARA